MSTIMGSAQLMPGSPQTESGQQMPLASWYHLTPALAGIEYVTVTNHGVYEADSTGRIHDFFACLYERRAVDSHSDVLHHIGGGYELAGSVVTA